jgi:hypothetical protein
MGKKYKKVSGYNLETKAIHDARDELKGKLKVETGKGWDKKPGSRDRMASGSWYREN